jgi:prepilin-type N-terminal cleavage/methylation domain-containing protein
MFQTWRHLRAHLARAASHARKQDGYTLVELVATMAIMGVITATITAGVAIGMRTMMSVGEIAASESRAASAVADITENVTLASPILAISRNRLVLLRDSPGRCERHQYAINRDSEGVPRSLQHTVQSIRSVAGLNCSDLSDTFWTGVSASEPKIIIDNLAANPDGEHIFTYAAPGRLDITLPGEDGFNAGTDFYGPCDISQVTVTLSVRPTTEQMVQTLRSTASPRAYGLGLRC